MADFLRAIVTEYLFGIGEEAKAEREKNVLALVEHNTDAFFLDCGPGDGQLTLRTAKHIGTKNIHALDVDPYYIKKTKTMGIRTKKADLNKRFPLKDHCADVIMTVEVIEHLTDVDTFMSELVRVTKPGGYVILATENLASWHNIFLLIFGYQPSTGPHISKRFPVGFHPLYEKHESNLERKLPVWNPSPHISVMTRDALRRLCRAYGFVVEDERASGCYPLGGVFARIFATLDKPHALTVLLKLRKVQGA